MVSQSTSCVSIEADLSTNSFPSLNDFESMALNTLDDKVKPFDETKNRVCASLGPTSKTISPSLSTVTDAGAAMVWDLCCGYT